jgi:putative acetyltransferase
MDVLNLSPRDVTPDDYLDVSVLLATAFDGPGEARLVEQLRKDGDIGLELVCEDQDGIYGYICFARMVSPFGFWSLSPVAIKRAYQGQGIGDQLIRRGLDGMRRAGAAGVVVLGDPDFYTRFGFSKAAAAGLDSPYSRAHTMVYPIATGAKEVTGRLVYPPAFSVL